MCGIAGFLSRTPHPERGRQVTRMARALAHRGPDDEGVALFALDGSPPEAAPHLSGDARPVGLAHRRLSILDLSPAGHQPMADPTGRYWLTFNGEIYNYLELMPELEALGYRFRSQSDSEVLLYAYAAWGEACLHRFNGMFAFAIWDDRDKRLFAARDRLGVKPFYYWHSDNDLAFASEIKALLTLPDVPRKPCLPVVARYLVEGYGITDQSQDSFFAGIVSLPGGHWLSWSPDAGVTVSRWWRLGANTQATPGDPEAFRALFDDAVRLRLRSDVPLGSLLSGGLDSSAIITTMFALTGTPPATFSAYGNTPETDERPYMAAVAQAVGAKAEYIGMQADGFMAALPKIVFHLDEPYAGTSIYPQWLVLQAARKGGLTVLLNGQGGDESLAGYAKFLRYYLAGLMQRGKLGQASREATAFGRPDALWPAARIALAEWRGYRGSISPAPAYMHPDLIAEMPAQWVPPEGPTPLRRELRSSLTLSPLPSLLRLEDRMSMAHSLETRHPFLDYRLVEFMDGLPDEAAISGGWTKRILRQAMSERLPAVVRDRKSKMGFETPAADWFRGPLAEWIGDLLHSRSFIDRGFVHPQRIQGVYDQLRANPGDHRAFGLWPWVHLELWAQTFMDPVTPAPVSLSSPAVMS
ncbi:MAG: asparagine synthase (glutamine-hydrolyzing) [Candidatus Sericytochromatia bacterium]|nr:asparagine synthase (glutamine-hydrolyzing) [Candidatus Sericytochromatia bacterium]